jgi:hypothetical protein
VITPICFGFRPIIDYFLSEKSRPSRTKTGLPCMAHHSDAACATSPKVPFFSMHF